MVFNKSISLGEILRNFQSKSPTKASAIVSKEGLLIASILDADFNEELIAGMAAEMLVLGEKTTSEILSSQPNKIIIESNKGTVVLLPAGDEAIFFSVVKGKNLGLVLFNMEVAANEIINILK